MNVFVYFNNVKGVRVFFLLCYKTIDKTSFSLQKLKHDDNAKFLSIPTSHRFKFNQSMYIDVEGRSILRYF